VLKLINRLRLRGLRRPGGEYLPLLEAYAQTGEWGKTYQASKQVVSLAVELQPNLCNKWSRYAEMPALTLRLLRKSGASWPAHKEDFNFGVGRIFVPIGYAV